MIGQRGNRASHNINPYYPYLNHVELGQNQNIWRQMQQPYFSSPYGNMGSFNNPYHQPHPYGNEMMHQNSYPNMAAQGFPYNQYPVNGYPIQHNGMQMQQGNFSQSIFQNPLDPETNQNQTSAYNQYYANSYMNPYPKQSFIPKQPSGAKSIMNSFKGQDGSIDVNKMMNTAGQMLNAVNQVSSLVKGLGGIIKV